MLTLPRADVLPITVSTAGTRALLIGHTPTVV
jgi:hypothetical protein